MKGENEIVIGRRSMVLRNEDANPKYLVCSWTDVLGNTAHIAAHG